MANADRGNSRSFHSLRGMMLLVGGIAGVACTAELTNYGPPGGLKGKDTPAPVGGNPPPPAGDGGTIVTDPAKICATTPVAPPASCDATTKGLWKAKIYPMFQSGGSGGCAKIGCHAAGGSPPVISNDSSDLAWTQLVGYKDLSAKRYIDPCTSDANTSAMSCNLDGSCGTGMPKDALFGAADQAMIKSWLSCGAPANP